MHCKGVRKLEEPGDLSSVGIHDHNVSRKRQKNLEGVAWQHKATMLRKPTGEVGAALVTSGD